MPSKWRNNKSDDNSFFITKKKYIYLQVLLLPCLQLCSAVQIGKRQARRKLYALNKMETGMKECNFNIICKY